MKKMIIAILLLSLFLFGGISVASIENTVGSVGKVGRAANSLLSPVKSLLFGDYILENGSFVFEFKDVYDIHLDFNSDETFIKYKDYVFRVVEKLILDDKTKPNFVYMRITPRNTLRFWDDKYILNYYTSLSKPNLDWAIMRWEEQKNEILNGGLPGYVG